MGEKQLRKDIHKTSNRYTQQAGDWKNGKYN